MPVYSIVNKRTWRCQTCEDMWSPERWNEHSASNVLSVLAS